MARPKSKPAPSVSQAVEPFTAPPDWFQRGRVFSPQEIQDLKLAFLTNYANCGSQVIAARQAGVGRRTLLEWRHLDPEFDAVWKEVMDGFADKADATMYRRGMDDNYDPRASTQSLLAYLNAHHPNYTWREKGQSGGAAGPQITVKITYVERPRLGNQEALPDSDAMISISATPPYQIADAGQESSDSHQDD